MIFCLTKNSSNTLWSLTNSCYFYHVYTGSQFRTYQNHQPTTSSTLNSIIYIHLYMCTYGVMCLLFYPCWQLRNRRCSFSHLLNRSVSFYQPESFVACKKNTEYIMYIDMLYPFVGPYHFIIGRRNFGASKSQVDTISSVVGRNVIKTHKKVASWGPYVIYALNMKTAYTFSVK